MHKKLQFFLLIVFFYFFVLLTGTLFWILNVTHLALVLPLSVTGAAITVAAYIGIKYKTGFVPAMLVNGLFLAGTISLCVLFSTLVFDNSYDGQTYHYETQAAIVNGWNPLKQVLTAGTANIFFINHYAKGYETGAAFFWAFFKHPESGKALNILLLIAGWLYISFLLEELKITKTKFRHFFIALLIVFNPVTVYQLFTFYVDGQIAVLITLLIASLYLTAKTHSSLHLAVAVAVFCIMGDIKFTGLVYSVLIFGFFGLWLLLKKINIFRFVVAGVIAISITFLLIGYNPYITNTLTQSNPFYPLVGKNKIDIITPVQPASFAYKNAFQKFYGANFSESHNIHGHLVTPEPIFKIPFTFSGNEWLVFKGSECRIAGYGPIFGGVLLVSFLLLIVAVFNRKVIKNDAFIISVLVLLTLMVNPENWMSRYVPQLWLFPFCIAWLFGKNIYSTVMKKLIFFLMLMLTINIAGIAIVNWGVAGLISYKMHKEIQWVKTISQPVKMITNDFVAAKERLSLYEIKVNVGRPDTTMVIESNEYKLQNSQAIILLPPGTGKFQNTGILKLLDKKLE